MGESIDDDVRKNYERMFDEEIFLDTSKTTLNNLSKNFRENYLEMVGGLNLIEMDLRNKELKKFDLLSVCFLFLTYKDKTTSIDIRGNNLTDDDMIPLLVGLERNKSIRKLDLRNNKTCKQTCANVLKMLKWNTTVTSVELDEPGLFNRKEIQQMKLTINTLLEKNKEFLQIQENRNQNTPVDLSNRSLSGIPRSVLDCTWLKILNLSNNEIVRIQNIQKLPNLEELYLNNNKMEGIQKEILQLKKLKKLDLASNNLVRIPPALMELRDLEYLNFLNNPLNESHNKMPVSDPYALVKFLRETFAPNTVKATSPKQISSDFMNNSKHQSTLNYAEDPHSPINRTKTTLISTPKSAPLLGILPSPGSLDNRSNKSFSSFKGNTPWQRPNRNFSFNVKNMKSINTNFIGNSRKKDFQSKSVSFDNKTSLIDKFGKKRSSQKNIDFNHSDNCLLLDDTASETSYEGTSFDKDSSQDNYNFCLSFEINDDKSITYEKNLSFLMPKNISSILSNSKVKDESPSKKDKEKK